jgi:hypothetical protein
MTNRSRQNAPVTFRSLLRTSPNGRFSRLPLGRLRVRIYGKLQLGSMTSKVTHNNANNRQATRDYRIAVVQP